MSSRSSDPDKRSVARRPTRPSSSGGSSRSRLPKPDSAEQCVMIHRYGCYHTIPVTASSAKVFLDLPPLTSYDLPGALRGPNGLFFKHIVDKTAAYLTLAFDLSHIHVEFTPRKRMLRQTMELLQSLLDEVIKSYATHRRDLGLGASIEDIPSQIHNGKCTPDCLPPVLPMPDLPGTTPADLRRLSRLNHLSDIFPEDFLYPPGFGGPGGRPSWGADLPDFARASLGTDLPDWVVHAGERDRDDRRKSRQPSKRSPPTRRRKSKSPPTRRGARQRSRSRSRDRKSRPSGSDARVKVRRSEIEGSSARRALDAARYGELSAGAAAQKLRRSAPVTGNRRRLATTSGARPPAWAPPSRRASSPPVHPPGLTAAQSLFNALKGGQAVSAFPNRFTEDAVARAASVAAAKPDDSALPFMLANGSLQNPNALTLLFARMQQARRLSQQQQLLQQLGAKDTAAALGAGLPFSALQLPYAQAARDSAAAHLSAGAPKISPPT